MAPGRPTCAASPVLDNALAYVLATASDPTLRDAERALDLSRGVVEEADRRHPGHLDTLATAHAARGDFERAAAVQREALALVEGQAIPPEMLEAFEHALRSYEQGKPAR